MESGQPKGRITTNPTTPLEPRRTINYILGISTNDQYESKRQQKKLVRAATIKAKVNVVHIESNQGEAEPIDGPISFPSINMNRVIVPHYDALVLTLYFNGFDVHRVLVDLGQCSRLTATSSLHTGEAFFWHAKFNRANPLWFQRSNYSDARRCHTPCESRPVT